MECLSILPKLSGLKFHKVRIGNLSFIDSCSFLSNRLLTLATTYIESGGDLKYTNEMLQDYSDEAWSLLTRGKQILPYDYMTELSDLNEDRPPPLREAFYNTIKEQGITEENYKQCQSVWHACKCRTLRDYLLAYLRVDVGLLSDIFQDWIF